MANGRCSVHYEMPRSNHIHKSMLLRGVKFLPPALDRADIEATKGKANRSGRSFGGAPLRGDYGNGNGRGRGQISYADSRPNPFAAHINPNYAPPSVSTNSRGPPPSYPPSGWMPQPPGAQVFRGGVPPLGGGVPYGYPPPPQQHRYAPPPPPSSNHYNGGYVDQSRNGSDYSAGMDGRYNNQHSYGRGSR